MMRVRSLFRVLILFWFCRVFTSGEVEKAFNAALMKDIQANTTCGSPPERYFNVQQKDSKPIDRVSSMCNASDPSLAHPPKLMVDGSLATFWQSKASEDIAYITISLGQVFFVHQINIILGDYYRPGSLMLSKSSDHGSTFAPWHYIVSYPASTNCQQQFGVAYYAGNLDRVDRVLCEEYSDFFQRDRNETVMIDLNGSKRGDGSGISLTPALLAWFNASDVRLRFSNLFRVLDKWSYEWHHYSVREIEVLARCDCNGHGDGGECPLNETTKLRMCKCQNNTCGPNCGECCPAYNQFPWEKGSGAPWGTDNTTACHPCNCHKHSERCVYNATVSRLKLSMDASGNYSGGGVCLDCKHNTKGINCEECKMFYYRAVGKKREDIDSCKACSCNVNGTTNVTGVVHLDCVRDELAMQKFSGKQPGDCFCKQHVTGRQCDRCKPTYYRLTRNNALGCQECQCHLAGTVGNSNVCNGDHDGQCPCKTNVHLRDCSQCKDGFYDLKNSSSDGCKDCKCDRGGSVHYTACDKTSGKCVCRPNVLGQQCNRVPVGYYYPSLHFIAGDRDPYKEAGPSMTVQLEIPQAGEFRPVIYYSLPSSDKETVEITFWHSSNRFTNVTAGTKVLHGCNGNCQGTWNGFLALEKGTWYATVRTAMLNNSLQLDRLVAIPMDFIEKSILSVETRLLFNFTCDVIGNNMGLGTEGDPTCLSGVFSMTVAYLNGSLPCQCSPVGSNNHSSCSQYGGQCACKHGVEGRDCSRCKPGFYNLTLQGCTPCGCEGSNKVCNPLNGECECQANTVGRTCKPCACNGNSNKCHRSGVCLDCQHGTTGTHCEECVNGTYGNATEQQCQACNCHSIGSMSTDCHRDTGQCMCKANVAGRNCSTCKYGAYGLGANGCRECNCNAYGSTNLQCNDTGHCPCHANVTGMKCTKCPTGKYGLPVRACRECSCGIGAFSSSNCTNDVLGQCSCKRGVTGRACDQCVRFFTNLTSHGCTECPECVQKLLTVMGTTTNNSEKVKQDGKELDELRHMHSPLERRETTLQETQRAYELFRDRITTGKQRCEKLRTDDVHKANTTYLEFVLRANEINETHYGLKQRAAESQRDVAAIENKTLAGRQFVNGVENLVQIIKNTHEREIEEATAMHQAASQAVHHTMKRNFTEEFIHVHSKVSSGKNVSAFVEQTARKLLNQTTLARDLDAVINREEMNFTKLQYDLERTKEAFIKAIHILKDNFTSVQSVLQYTKGLLRNGDQALEETFRQAKRNDAIQNMTQENLQQATAAYERYKGMIATVTGELEVAMLHYDEKERTFSMKVLRGRNLAPRDLPSRTSDPYVIVTASPDWNNQGQQRSRILNGTTNPVYPQYHIFRFKFTKEQLLQTKIRLQVFDYDPSDEDDFLGETVIDLSKAGDLFNRIVTKWYPLRPQDLSDVNSGHFNASSVGLVDVSNLLQVQIVKSDEQLAAAVGKLTLARAQANALVSAMEQLNRTFDQARDHGSSSVEVVERYRTIREIINGSSDLLKSANEFFTAIHNHLSIVSLAELDTKAAQVFNNSSSICNSTMERNLTSPAIFMVPLQQARLSFHQALTQRHKINSFYPVLQTSAAKLSNMAKEAPQVQPVLSLAERSVESTSITLNNLQAQLQELDHTVDDLREKIVFVNMAFKNKSQLIDDSRKKEQQITTKLNQESNINTNVLSAMFVMEKMPETRSDMELRLNRQASKVNKLMSLPTQFHFALETRGNSSFTYPVPERSRNRTQRNEIKLDVRTNSSSGLLFSMVQSPTDLSSKEISDVEGNITSYLNEGKVHVAINLTKGPIVIVHPQRIDDNMWHSIYYEFKWFYNLTICIAIGKDHVTWPPRPWPWWPSRPFQLPWGAIYVGGLPLHLEDRNTYGYFIGVIDRLVVDQVTIDLWKPETFHGVRLYSKSPYYEKFFPPNGVAFSFFGHGYLQQNMGDFTIFQTPIIVQLQFRSLKSSGMIMAVTDEQHRCAFSLYLLQGAVNFRFEIGSGSLRINTEKSTYSDGKWYLVVITITRVNATLAVKPVGSNTAMDARLVNTEARVTRKGVLITFGGPNPHSNVTPPTSEPFAGDLKNIKLSNSKTNTLDSRYFNAPQTINYNGGTYIGVIRGKIERGVRFYGYLDDTEKVSFAELNVSSEEVSSLTFTFKTKEDSGVLLYSSNKEHGSTLYLALWHGKLLALLRNSSLSTQTTPVLASNATYNNGAWHKVHLNYTDTGYSLYVNDLLVRHLNPDGNSGRLWIGSPVFVGGVPSHVTIPINTPITMSFIGGMLHFLINEIEIDLLSGNSKGVSKAGVTPAYVPPLPPPTCAAPLGPLAVSTDSQMIGFRSQGLGNTSYMGYGLNAKQTSFFSESYVVAMEFRAMGSNGLIFYAADNHSNPSQFVSLEMVGGRLKYQFSTGQGQPVAVQTDQRYDGNGKWYRVYFLRMAQLGVLYVLHYDYKNVVGDSSIAPTKMNLKSPIYLGGLPSTVKTPNWIKQKGGFNGCVRFLSISSAKETHKVDLTQPEVRGSGMGAGSCYSTVQAGSGFNGSAWLRFNKLNLSQDFNIHLEFRTSARNGILFYMVNGSSEERRTNSQGSGVNGGPAKSYLSLEQINGQLMLSYNTEVNSTAVWTDPAVANTTATSYQICQMSWHTISVIKTGTNVTLKVDKYPVVVSQASQSIDMEEDFYVGGLPAGMHKRGNPNVAGFKGCIRNLRVNNQALSPSHASQHQYTTFGCPLNSEEKRKISIR